MTQKTAAGVKIIIYGDNVRESTYLSDRNRAFTVKQAAEYLGVCKKTLYRLISSKRIDAYSITQDRIRPTYRIRKSSIDEYIHYQRL